MPDTSSPPADRTRTPLIERSLSRTQSSGLLVLSVIALVVGAWAFVEPASFASQFPWVAGVPAASNSLLAVALTQLYASAYLGFGVAFFLLLIFSTSRGCIVVGVAWMVFQTFRVVSQIGMLLAEGTALAGLILAAVAMLAGVALLVPVTRGRATAT